MKSRGGFHESKKSGGNLYLMGFMGCGKTTVGRELSSRLRRPFVDTDETIEGREGRSILHIFNTDGEDYFRKIERRIIREIASRDGHVVSLGGGAVLHPANWKRIARSGRTVTLAFPSHILADRLSHRRDRPLLHDPGIDLMAMIRYLSNQREPVYQRADLYLYYDSPVAVGRIVQDILHKLSADDARD